MNDKDKIMTRSPSLRRPFWFLFLLFSVAFSVNTQAAQASEYWAVWDGGDEGFRKTVNHQNWQDILDEYLVVHSAGNTFRYQAVSQADREKLKDYLSRLSTVEPLSYSKAEQKAFWINLYNALTVDLILKNYPLESITDIGPWYRFGPWDEKVITVAGLPLTLNDIEHRILRPLWEDNRIHYAVNCASMGCPDLSPQVFTAANTEQLLDKLADRFVSQEKGVTWIDGRLVLSRIYEWYEVDFVDKDGVLLHLQKYARPDTAKKIKSHTGIVKYRYDWRLNEPQ
ncbi:DUF547 domain-containing protein [Endozoicomonas ascidiicola]|uniref:DUF547 domain-containing protein n=1 Tax=Endozoicomonas ascidiicola TaxID=1698521 RepID=UPI000AE075F6|nr:DUF547 domain-containing protein [Endozoicomonas ascidiicola]